MLVWDHWHIEPSSICTLRCPRCPRAEVPETLLNRQLTLEFFQSQLQESVIRGIRKITFCGNDGDPIYCREFVDICQWIKTVNPDLHLVIITNGSHKPATWWTALAKVLNAHDEINWSLDGWDQQSNSQYRVNSDWQSIMSGYQSFAAHNHTTYRIWASIAFSFNEHQLDHMRTLAVELGFDLFQITKSTKFGKHYPDTYGQQDPLQPRDSGLIAAGHRFQRDLAVLTDRRRPSDPMKTIFWQRAQTITPYSALCMVGNKGVFLDSQGRFYPCCWTANRYDHNHMWHELAADRFNLNRRSFQDILEDPFWKHEFLKFDSAECQTKCNKPQLKNFEHATEW